MLVPWGWGYGEGSTSGNVFNFFRSGVPLIFPFLLLSLAFAWGTGHSHFLYLALFSFCRNSTQWAARTPKDSHHFPSLQGDGSWMKGSKRRNTNIHTPVCCLFLCRHQNVFCSGLMILFDIFLSFLIPLSLLLPPPTHPTYLHTQKEGGRGFAVSSVTSEGKEASKRKPIITSSSTWKVCLNLNTEKLRKLFREAREGTLFLPVHSASSSIREPIHH